MVVTWLDQRTPSQLEYLRRHQCAGCGRVVSIRVLDGDSTMGYCLECIHDAGPIDD